MAEESLEEVRAWKEAASKGLAGLSPAEKLKKIKDEATAYKKMHGLAFEKADIASDAPKKVVTMNIPVEIVPRVQKLIDDYENKKTG